MRNNIANMQPYSWGEQPEDPAVIKLNTNENPYPPSDKVAEVLKNFDSNALRRYPNAYANELRNAISKQHGLSQGQVVITNGGDEALRLAITTFVEPMGNIGSTDPTYSLYEVLAAVQDARMVTVPLNENLKVPTNFCTELNKQGVDLAFLVNPHAPTGILTDTNQIARFAKEFAGVLIIDEAYVDFVDPDSGYGSTHLLADNDNLMILRSFSKGYSLAGLRLGYLLGPESLVEPILTKSRDSYNIDAISQALGLAAFCDQDYAEKTWSKVRVQRQRLRAELLKRNFSVVESQANFLLATPPSGDSAESLYTMLKTKDILVRHFNTPLLADKLRISVGTEKENTALLNALDHA